MADKATRNEFTGGMVLDSLESLHPQNAYRYALNSIHQSENAIAFGLTNEQSDLLVAELPDEIRGYSHIEARDQTLLFVGSGSLYLFDHIKNTVTFVASDSEFGCNWNFDKCEFLYAEFKYFNHCNELHAYFSSGCVYYVVNIDELLDPKRKQAVKDCEDCTYFQVFRAICGPHLSATPIEFAGSAFEGGSVSFVVQLEDNDGNQTNWFDISSEVKIPTENNRPGEVAIGGARLTVDGLDQRYNKINIAVIKTVAGVTTVEKLGTQGYSSEGFSYDYYGQKGELVDISVVTTKSKAFLRGRDLLQKDGRLFFYNLKNERNLNYQRRANNVRVQATEFEVTMEQNLKYNYPSLLRGEVYAFAIVWKYADGTYSVPFHLPGQGGCTSDCSGSTTQAANIETQSEGEFKVQNTNLGVLNSDSDAYAPIDVSAFNTDGQFDRLRNPSLIQDRPQESDPMEEAVEADRANIDTVESDVVDSGECTDDFYGCENGAGDALFQDLGDYSNTHQNQAELLGGYGLDQPDPTLNQTTSLKDAAARLTNATINREYITRIRPTIQHTGSQPQASTGETSSTIPSAVDGDDFVLLENNGNDFEVPTPVGQFGSLRGDNWVDAEGNILAEEKPRRIWEGDTKAYCSSVQYPDTKDCEGKRMYPTGPIRHHRMPSTSERPHFVSYQNGVVNKYQPENYEYGNTYVRLLGLKVDNIEFPSEEELPKPLCPNSPYKIVYVKRTEKNKSVFAKGWTTGMFQGEALGTQYLFPRNGVNSFETVDRFISPTDDPLSRKGTHFNGNAYTFHSPDTDCVRGFLPITHVQEELNLKGNGWMHGLYAKGKEPTSDQWNGTRKDQRGARVSNNINHYDQSSGRYIDVSGITYAPGDSVVSPGDGFTFPLMNRYRESCVYLELGAQLEGNDRDKSWHGGVLDHFGPTESNSGYISLIRCLPDQYGDVEGLAYIDLGLNATKAHGRGIGSINGICGDTWIGPYSKRRTSYVSNKVGNFYNPPQKPGSPCRERSICESPDDKIFEVIGLDHYPSNLPESGDKWDPKNYAGLHTVTGVCGPFGLSRQHASAIAQSDSESDFYYPRVLKSLVHSVVESHVNPWLRETGEGSQLRIGRVWYPKLKDLYLDSDAPSSHPWEESFLNRFYCAVEQPSLRQRTLKALIRSFINIITPVFALTRFDNFEALIDTTAGMLTWPMLIAWWIFSNNVLFTDRKLNKLLGIGQCLRDEEGGDLDDRIENWEDAYCRYNFDYSKVSDELKYYAPTSLYNTCDCDSCTEEESNNEVYHSNKQNLDSEVDAYRNVSINQYNEIPAHAGRLRRLFLDNNAMYAHTTEGIWTLRFSLGGIPEDIGSQITGAGELLVDPVLIFEGSSEGFLGTGFRNAQINVGGWGYFFIDEVARKIYRFNGSPEEISRYGMFNFFKENIKFCVEKDCVDEKHSVGIGYSLGWDPRHDRLIVTKQDGDECSSWTASYTPMGTDGRGKWISFHSYIRQGYFNDRNNLYSYSAGKIFKHHRPNHYQTFDDQLFPFIVETIAVPQDLSANAVQSMRLRTEAEKAGDRFSRLKGLDTTFNKIAIWNDTQGTGTRDLVVVSDDKDSRNRPRARNVSDYSKIRAHKNFGAFDLNEIKDLILETCKHDPLFVKDCECQVIPDVNEAIFDCTSQNKQDYVGRYLLDRYTGYRLIFDSASDVRLYLLYVELFLRGKEFPK